MIDISVDHIRGFFSEWHRNEQNNPVLKRAGVLIPLFMKDGKLHVVLTKRTNEVEHHKGQVSFPGGTMDKTDATIVDTALREAEEEIGLLRNSVEILGLFNDFCTPSGFCITPVIAFLPFLLPFEPNKAEVSEIFNVPLSLFLDSANERVEQRIIADKIINVYFYRYSNYEVWGATAAITRSFLSDLIKFIESKKTL